MKLEEFIGLMDEIAPQSLAMDFDNVGLIAAPDHDDIKRVLVALDLTTTVANEAVAMDADLVLTHHPRLFSGAKRISPSDPATAALYILMRHGIGHFAAHTNLDSVEGGVSSCLAKACAVKDTVPMPVDMMGRIGNLDAPMRLDDYARFVSDKLEAQVRVAGDRTKLVSRVAVLGGAGGDNMSDAFDAGADVYITGEIKHHQVIEAVERGKAVIEAGHYETERVVLPELIIRLQERSIDVQYRLTRCETSPLSAI